jgi:hypothetical protein
MTIAQDGSSRYTIVIAAQASPSERHAAEELQSFLKQISGATIPVVGDDQEIAGPMILVGGSEQLARVAPDLDVAPLGDEGFVIKTVGPHLALAGGRLRGSMYVVYTFLEDYLGCRWYSSKVSKIPKRKAVRIDAIDRAERPAFAYREPFYTDAFDADWAARNKANGNRHQLDEARGGKISYSHFVHTFYQLVPPDRYYDEHPEYFSLVGGERKREGAQLCLTNPDVLRIATETVMKWIEQAPGATIFSVSQNDCFGPCECPNCKAIDDREGSHAGSLLAFVNALAEQVEKRYPDKLIDTLAYQYTRKPPKTIRPRRNVLVRLCSIECCFSHPLATPGDEVNAAFVKDIEGWSQLTDRLYVWDYVTDFRHYILPFPNWDVLAPNLRFFRDHGVEGVFEEGNYSAGGGGEFAELRAYVLAKALWNPNVDQEAVMADFLKGYYGKGWRPLLEYITMLRDKVRRDNIHMSIWVGPDAPYLTDEIIDRAEHLFDRAEILAENDDVRERIRIARLPIRYVLISRRPDAANRERLIDEFEAVAKRAGITNISEGRTLDDWLAGVRGGK